jgi:hypothetical protein
MSDHDQMVPFDPNEVEPAKAFEPLPPGDYVVGIVGAKIKKTKDGTGWRVALEIVVSEGDHRGRKMWPGINIVNASQEAQDIGQREYTALVEACGLTGERDVTKLVGRECVASVKIRPAEGVYEARNDVKGWKPLGSAGLVDAAPEASAPAKRAKPSFV